MPTIQTIDLRPAIEPIVREILRPLEEKIQQLEQQVKEQQQQIEELQKRK